MNEQLNSNSANLSFLQYLTFNSSEDCYAVGILAIKEIIEFGNVTHVPLVPAFIKGVINLRGSVVPVIDLNARLYDKAVVVGKRTCVIIIEVEVADEVMELGVAVDSVNEVIELTESDLTEAPHFGSRIRADFIEAMAKIKDRLIIILSIENVLSVAEFSQLVSMTTSQKEAS